MRRSRGYLKVTQLRTRVWSYGMDEYRRERQVKGGKYDIQRVMGEYSGLCRLRNFISAISDQS